MSTPNDAADALRRHIKGLEALQTAAGYLDRIAAIEQWEAEAKSREADAGHRAAAAEERITAFKAEEDQILARRAQEADAHEQLLKSTLETAQASAQALVENATADVARIKAQAEAGARDASDRAGAEVAQARAERDAALKDAQDAKDEVAAAKAELAAVETKINQARARIAEMLR